jgi:hypothetical protein
VVLTYTFLPDYMIYREFWIETDFDVNQELKLF